MEHQLWGCLVGWEGSLGPWGWAPRQPAPPPPVAGAKVPGLLSLPLSPVSELVSAA